MVKRMPTNCGDETCPSCVVAGNYVFLSHHAGACDKDDVQYQLRECFLSLKKTLESTRASLDNMVQITLYLKTIDDFQDAREVFYEFFHVDHMPARMTATTQFLDKNRLCMVDGVAYKENRKITYL